MCYRLNLTAENAHASPATTNAFDFARAASTGAKRGADRPPSFGAQRLGGRSGTKPEGYSLGRTHAQSSYRQNDSGNCTVRFFHIDLPCGRSNVNAHQPMVKSIASSKRSRHASGKLQRSIPSRIRGNATRPAGAVRDLPREKRSRFLPSHFCDHLASPRRHGAPRAEKLLLFCGATQFVSGVKVERTSHGTGL